MSSWKILLDSTLFSSLLSSLMSPGVWSLEHLNSILCVFQSILGLWSLSQLYPRKIGWVPKFVTARVIHSICSPIVSSMVMKMEIAPHELGVSSALYTGIDRGKS